jgi:glutamine amidotransferase
MTDSSPSVGIVDYGAGNTENVIRAFKHLGIFSQLVSHGLELEKFSHAVIPGVGSYNFGASKMREKGFDVALKLFAEEGKPILGICLGMQLLSSEGHEHGLSRGLDLLPGTVLSMEDNACDSAYGRVPHTGWTRVRTIEGLQSKLFEAGDFYFSHSFRFTTSSSPEIVSGTYIRGGSTIVAAVERGNVFGVQFHPEKSGEMGLALLKRFALLQPE